MANVEFNENYVKEITEIAERGKANSHRLDEHDESLKEIKKKEEAFFSIASSIEKLCMQFNSMKENIDDKMNNIQKTVNENTTDIKGIKEEVTEIKQNPIKTKAGLFDSAVGYLIMFVGGGLFSWILSQAFPAIFK